MQTATILGALLAALFALLVVFWQYYFRSVSRGSRTNLLAFLRFIAVFGVLLLLLNPKISRIETRSQKQDLILLFDNSRSMRIAGAAERTLELLSDFLGSEALAERFNVRNYSFGQGLHETDSLDFSSDVSDISEALSSVEAIYGREKALAILVSDGNQTYGKAYEYLGPDLNFPVYSLVVGDTTKYSDLKISQVNLNTYGFLNNSFPLEVFVTYQGKDDIAGRLTISMDGRTVYRQDLDLDTRENSEKITTSLKAEEVGFKTIELTLDAIPGERNIVNNRRRVSIEIIDEKTRVGIVSEVVHPDLGALTKAIESNQQRQVTLIKPQATEQELSAFDMLILYQPDRSFDAVYRYLEKSGMNTFTLSGPGTDWRYLNGVLEGLTVNNFNQAEEILPSVNPAFSLFDISDFSVDEFPPLLGSLGEILITRPYQSILEQQIKGMVLQEPLLPIIYSEDERKHAYLFGENIWKWRIQSFRNDQDFENFDRLINKIIFYLTSDDKRDRLNVDYQPLYTVASDRSIKASFYDATFAFDGTVTLKLDIRGIDNTYALQQNMILSGTQYKADLRDLPPGEYAFSITVVGEDLRREGRFRVEDFNLEQLFISSDYGRLGQLSQGSGGKLFYPDQKRILIDEITKEPGYSPIQKSVENVVSLIDFKILLGLIVIALTAEWFIRKYNGLI